jgi:membrane-bound lytic murein transglycosylase B
MQVRYLFLFLFSLWWPHTAAAADHLSDQPEVKKFISQMVTQHHFVRAELIALLNAVKPRPTVINSVKAPLEQKPWRTYQMLFVNEWRVREGVEFWNKYRTALARAEKKYGVPASIIVATIGVETKYGKNTGNYRVLDALANLAFSDSPRAPFFRSELKEFLLLVREEHLDPLKVMGSYAGAIGQPQFMPSSYRHYAVNFSGNAKIDLSHNEIDVIGSVANYYHKHGWKTDRPVAIKTPLTSHHSSFLSTAYVDPAAYGITTLSNEKTKLIELDGYFGREYWLGFHNFDVIKRYNPSNLYAMAVYQLSYYISTLKGKSEHA